MSKFRAVCWWVVLLSSLSVAQVAVTTFHNDNYRSGSNPHEISLTFGSVSVAHFGKLKVFPVTGFVYAQPLYVPRLVVSGTSHNVVFIATQHDQVYAFDTASGNQLWHADFLRSSNPSVVISTVSPSDVLCNNVIPEIGISGTPVIDTSSNILYVLAVSKEYNTGTHLTTFHQRLHALDLASGRDQLPPHEITATAPGTGTGSVGGLLTFDPLIQDQRPALLLANGQIYAGWASYCDLESYHGWFMAFDKTTLNPTGVFVDTANGYEGGFWASGSGAAADSGGAIYVPTGNGDFTASQGGSDFGDSILRLSWSQSGLAVSDYFTPWDQQTLDANDSDVASGGVLLLPDQPGLPHPHLLVQAGKEGTIDLVDRDQMGHWHAGNDDQIVQTLPYALNGIWGSPAFWNNHLYFSAFNDYLKAFAFDSHAQRLSPSPVSESAQVFYYPAPVPSVSSNGTNNGIVWAIETDSTYQYNAVLHAYMAGNLAVELYNSEQNSSRDRVGPAVNYTVPTIADGHVFVGIQNQVVMYGLLQGGGAGTTH